MLFGVSFTELDNRQTGEALEGTITELDQHMEDTLE